MKIIVPGIDLKTKVYWWTDKQFRCLECKCLFQMEVSDFKSNVDLNSDEIFTSCPSCQVKLKITNPDSECSVGIFGDAFYKDMFEDVFGKLSSRYNKL